MADIPISIVEWASARKAEFDLFVWAIAQASGIEPDDPRLKKQTTAEWDELFRRIRK